MELQIEGKTVSDCESVIIVPAKALEEHGYMQTITEDTSGFAKHQFHAMAQTAYFQYQDDEIEIEQVTKNIVIRKNEETWEIEEGVCLCRSRDNTLSAYATGDVNIKKMLEAAYRFCTRWVRLDI